MKEERKAKYVTPQIEIIEMESEGVMALSNMPGGNPVCLVEAAPEDLTNATVRVA